MPRLSRLLDVAYGNADLDEQPALAEPVATADESPTGPAGPVSTSSSPPRGPGARAEMGAAAEDPTVKDPTALSQEAVPSDAQPPRHAGPAQPGSVLAAMAGLAALTETARSQPHRPTSPVDDQWTSALPVAAPTPVVAEARRVVTAERVVKASWKRSDDDILPGRRRGIRTRARS